MNHILEVIIENIDVNKTLAEAEEFIERESKKNKNVSWIPMMRLLLTLLKILFKQKTLNSKNSSKPPSSDFPGNKKKKTNKDGSKRAPGGQKGHVGKTLKPIKSPDHIESINIDRRTLPKGQYTENGYEARQVIELITKSVVTEYRAQVLIDENANKFVAPFPEGVTRPIQYGSSVKAHAVYLSQFQLIPFARIQAQFTDQYNIPISIGTIANFNKEAYERLENFEKVAKEELASSKHAHADETGVNIDAKTHWLHCFSTQLWTFIAPHAKRGTEAMNDIGIFPIFSGTLCHDHWKPYYQYSCTHALCNAHHLRELLRSFEQDGQMWAENMRKFLLSLNKAVDKAGGVFSSSSAYRWRKKYRKIISDGEIECPPPETSGNKRGRVKRSKSRNLLERLKEFESDVLRFMLDKDVPFTNNQGERDIRMTKVQQKISGCFRAMEGAKAFCTIRSYISTCQKQRVTSSEALNLLFNGEYPKFIQEKAAKLLEHAE